MKTLLHEDFSGLRVGPFPCDNSAMGEYHYYPPKGERGRWYEGTNWHGWQRTAAWAVIEDDGRHRMLQCLDTEVPLRMLVTGEPLWSDYTLEVVLQPLTPGGFAGVLFRYQTSRTHYRFGLEGGGRLVLVRADHEDQSTLAEKPFEYSCDRTYTLTVTTAGERIRAWLDGDLQFDLRDDRYRSGRVGLGAQVPTLFDSCVVTVPEPAYAAYIQTRDREERELDELRRQYPRPVPWKRIDTRGFGTGRHIRFGHLTGDDNLQMVLAQNLKLMPGNGDLATVRCLTAVNLDGEVLWQFGEPSADPDAGLLTADVPVQVYDIDGDGRDEVLCLKNFKLYILNGADGSVKDVFPLPQNPHEENHFGRLTGDSIIIANFRGLERPSDILIKNRYHQVWAYDSRFNLLWTHRCNTGHFAQPYDFDGDGRDELFVGYTLLGPEGEVRWSLPWGDHTDEIAIGPFDPSRDDVQIAIVSGEEGFNILSPEGEVLYREHLGHAQRLAAARFRGDLPGLQFYVVTFWGNPGIISLHDSTGKPCFSRRPSLRGAAQRPPAATGRRGCQEWLCHLEFEPGATGNVLNPVNWTGTGTELALLSGSVRHGGLLDGHGRRVVLFPEDGHPELCAEAVDLTGDARDEIVLWDLERIWIYTQEGPFEGERIYSPIRYPHYNASNYRAEISLPRWA